MTALFRCDFASWLGLGGGQAEPGGLLCLAEMLVPPDADVDLACAQVKCAKKSGGLSHLAGDGIGFAQKLPDGPWARSSCVGGGQVSSGGRVLAPRELDLPQAAVRRDIVRIQGQRGAVAGQGGGQINLWRATESILDRPLGPFIDG